MSLETFKEIFHKIPKNLTQIAFGIGSIDANPDLWKILEYCRKNDYNYVVPNITINGYRLKDEHVEKLAKICGAVAVSRYNPDVCYDAVQRLTAAGLKQVNIHQLLAKETLESCWGLLKDIQEDERLHGLNAAVFLLLKPKGKRNNLTQLKDFSQYKEMIDYALERKLPIGFDSCTASSFLRAVKERPDYDHLSTLAEPCESTCFSLYINVDGESTPCSFCEGELGIEPINILQVTDFMDEIWSDGPLAKFRAKLLCNERRCPMFDLEME
jgi:MoaA/NifB/PqqE/SkfB family radical SAM enzyme